MIIVPRKAVPAVLLLLALLAGPAWAQLELPETAGEPTQDYAGVLSGEVRQQIEAIQNEADDEHDTPIVVVTIGSMAEYGGMGYDIERFAEAWFERAGISKWTMGRGQIDQGILLLVSVGDRRTHIEFGADWPSRWSDYVQRVIDDDIVPACKMGDYDGGVLAGVERLAAMAEAGPDGRVGGFGAMSRRPFFTSPLPLWAIIILSMTGAALVAISFMPLGLKLQGGLLLTGLLLVVVGPLFWLLIPVAGLLVVLKLVEMSGYDRERGSPDASGAYGGGFGYFGGFGGGGFGGGGGGGGGASGGW